MESVIYGAKRGWMGGGRAGGEKGVTGQYRGRSENIFHLTTV